MQRLVNYLVDTILYYVFLYELFKFTGYIIVGNAKATAGSFSNDTTGAMFMAYASLPLLYTLFETFTRGRSPGKFITGTIAVRTNLSALTFGNTITRSLLRMLPFDPLSGLFGPPLHDRITGTIVVKKNSIVY
jgi:uncharacterized RDD family membrane protein YckC